jgi:hypothetical protein
VGAHRRASPFTTRGGQMLPYIKLPTHVAHLFCDTCRRESAVGVRRGGLHCTDLPSVLCQPVLLTLFCNICRRTSAVGVRRGASQYTTKAGRCCR